MSSYERSLCYNTNPLKATKLSHVVWGVGHNLHYVAHVAKAHVSSAWLVKLIDVGKIVSMINHNVLYPRQQIIT